MRSPRGRGAPVATYAVSGHARGDHARARRAIPQFLAYIAAGITSIVLFAGATRGEGVAAQLAAIAQHTTDVRLTILLTLVMNLSALVLAVTLYAITRDQDRDLAMWY
ncbi:MAG: DUF4386 family protein [Gemmatimonadales bacterium]